MTGRVAHEGQEVRAGYEYWQHTVNERGGVDVGGSKYLVEMKFYDDRSNAHSSALLTEKLIVGDKIHFILGPYSSAIGDATSAVCERHRMLTLLPAGNADEIYERGYRYVFSILPPASTYMCGVLDMALTLSPVPRRLALLVRDDHFGVASGEGTDRHARKRGYEVVFKTRYEPHETEFRGVLEGAVAARPDVVIASTLLQDAIAITRTAADLSFAPKMLCFKTAPSIPRFVGLLGDQAESVCGSSWWLPSLKYRGPVFGSTSDYAAGFERFTGYRPYYFAAAGSMAGLVLQLAIEAAGTLDTDAVRSALRVSEPESFWGPVGWNDRGQNFRGLSFPSQIQDGRLRGVWPPSEREAALRYPFPGWGAR